jgi:hypothetical protein
MNCHMSEDNNSFLIDLLRGKLRFPRGTPLWFQVVMVILEMAFIIIILLLLDKTGTVVLGTKCLRNIGDWLRGIGI